MVPKVVLTGGPCAGKTSCLLALRERLGGRLVAVPEAATLLLAAGFPPPGHERVRRPAAEWVEAFQASILATQQTLEDSSEKLAPLCGARLIVCDRGVLDGAAYWPGGRAAFLRRFGLSLADCFARYRAVLHLQSLAESHPHLYGPGGNAVRYEQAADALRVERAVRDAWEGHPGLVVFPAGEEPQAKIERVVEHVEALLASPGD